MNWEKVFFVISRIGSFPAYLLLVVFSFFFGRTWFFLSLLIMIFFTSVIAYGIKWLFPTRRPDKKRRALPKKRTLWNHWRFVDQSSFPSAHTAFAAGLFVLVMIWYSWHVMSLLAFLFLVVVGWSRIKLAEHYMRDVLAGLVLGLVVALLAWQMTSLFVPLL